MCIPLLPLGLVLMVLAVLRFRSIPALYETSICIRCRYSLQGLPRTGTCPECGRVYDLDSDYLANRLPLSSRERIALDAVPLVMAFVAARVGFAQASKQFNLPLELLAITTGLISILPALVINHAADSHVSRWRAWLLSLVGSLPGAALAAAAFADVPLGTDQSRTLAAWIPALYGLTVSTLLAGLFGLVAAHDAIRRLRAA